MNFPITFRLRKNRLLSIVVAFSLGIALSLIGVDIDRLSSPGTIRVVLNDKGFNSDLISITEGSTLIWKIEGAKKHWPASDPHPFHSQYPEFGGCVSSLLDACRPLQSGEEYSFKFTQPGDWSVHDHLYPGFTMVVEVTSRKPILKGIISEVQSWFELGRSMNQQAFIGLGSESLKQENLIRKLSLENPDQAWDYLKKTLNFGEAVVPRGHSFAHLVGNGLYQKYGFQGVSHCDSTFSYGCFHGVIEKMLIDQGELQIGFIEQECLRLYPVSQDPSKSYLSSLTGCIHGVGHGLFTVGANDLKKALNYCDRFSLDYQNYCYDGVFMENSESASSAILTSPKPWLLCSDTEKKYWESCARYLPIFALKMLHWDFQSSSQLCYLENSIGWRTNCLIVMGNIAAQSSSGDLGKIRTSCAQISSDDGKNTCLKAAAIEVKFQKYSDSDSVSNVICQDLPPEYQRGCYYQGI